MKWTTKDGRVMEISEMSNSHLENAFNMVYRKAVEKLHEPVFDSLFAVASTLNTELLRRDIHTHEDHYAELENEFMTYDGSDFDDGFSPLDHWEAMRSLTGKGVD